MKVVNCELKIITSLSTLECFGDGETLLIAFENIIENQLRYAKSTIDIIIKDRTIYISNDGPKFESSPDELFEIYKKGTSGQFGLGLAITKKVITSHGGSIKAYNTDNGVCFEMIL
jgi:two-component system sensor histidine kinase CssS